MFHISTSFLYLGVRVFALLRGVDATMVAVPFSLLFCLCQNFISNWLDLCTLFASTQSSSSSSSLALVVRQYTYKNIIRSNAHNKV